MAGEAVVESMVFRMIGDGKSYGDMLEKAASSTETAVESVNKSIGGLKSLSEETKSSIDKVNNGLQAVGVKALAGTADGVDAITESLDKLAGKSDVLDTVKSEFITWKDKAKSVIDSITGIPSAFDKVRDNIASFVSTDYGEKFANGWETAKNVLVKSGSYIAGTFASIKTATLAATASLKTWVVAAASSGALIGVVGAGFLGVMAIKELVNNTSNYRKEVEALDKVLEEAIERNDKVRESYEKGTKALSTQTDELETYRERLESVEEAIGEQIIDWEELQERIDEAQEKLAAVRKFSMTAQIGDTTGFSDKAFNASQELWSALEAMENARKQVEQGKGSEGLTGEREKLLVQIEREKQAIEELKKKYDDLNSSPGRLFKEGPAAFGKNIREFDEQMKLMSHNVKEWEKDLGLLDKRMAMLEKKKGIDEEATKKIDEFIAKTKLANLTFGMTPSEATIFIGERKNVSLDKIKEAKEEATALLTKKNTKELTDDLDRLTTSMKNLVQARDTDTESAKLQAIQQKAAAKGIELSAEKVAAAKKAIQSAQASKEFEETKRKLDAVTAQFMTPLEKYEERVDELDKLLARGLSADTYERAMEDAAKRLNGVGDAARRAGNEVRKLDAALVGSAEDQSRLSAYFDMLRGDQPVRLDHRHRASKAKARTDAAGKELAAPPNPSNPTGKPDEDSVFVLKQIRDFIQRNADKIVSLDFANIS